MKNRCFYFSCWFSGLCHELLCKFFFLLVIIKLVDFINFKLFHGFIFVIHFQQYCNCKMYIKFDQLRNTSNLNSSSQYLADLPIYIVSCNIIESKVQTHMSQNISSCTPLYSLIAIAKLPSI
jgi:hypothetical protein